MQILFQHTFEHPVWRIIPSFTDISTWVIEIRNASNQQVEFYYIGQDLMFKKLIANLNWWSGVENVLGDIVIFHEYIQKDLPIHKGVKVLNAASNQLLWENDFVAYTSANYSHLKVKALLGSSEKALLLEIKTGLKVESDFEKNSSFENPIAVIGENQLYFKEISSFIQKYTHMLPVHLCEYLEEGNSIVISYYVTSNTFLENYLLATNLEGEELLHLCIATELKGVATGTFNVSNSLISFVKDRKELFISSLN